MGQPSQPANLRISCFILEQGDVLRRQREFNCNNFD
jgi:hypothetical protein